MSFAPLLALPLCVPAGPALTLRTPQAEFVVDASGQMSSIRRRVDGREFRAAGQSSPLVQIRVDGTWSAPERATWDPKRRRLALSFANGVRAEVRAESKSPSHVVFELVDLRPAGRVDLLWWGPYATTIGDVVGEVVGVVRDSEFAIGVQALNAKTLGGAPADENDIGIDGQTLDDPGHYPDLPVELSKDQLFRGNTAWPTPFGSVLQAFCRDRGRDRIVANWGHEHYVAPALNDGGVVGSRIALFACPADKALATIGRIEKAEGLPHPILDGVWAKTSPRANLSYLILDFGEDTIDQAIAMTQRAGLRYLYHSSPFETWGRFHLKPSLFPNGEAGFRKCVEQAKRAGIRVGVHSLSNFITPNDPYVTPTPDPRLARIGTSRLEGELSADQTEIQVEAPDCFAKRTDLNTVAIGNELVRYESVSSSAPWRLLGCQRGAWGTRATAHPPGEPVGKLMDHPYNVFLTNADLSREVARNLAEFGNRTGVRQISLDGLEGNWSTGHGQYGRVLFTQSWYEALSDESRGEVRNDASNPSHFTWHIATYYNWGEPWYAGFRESQTLYRFKNQLLYTRNLLPRMLGWFSLRPETTLADAEWLLARAAGYDAGFALAASMDSAAQRSAAGSDSLRLDAKTTAILDAVREWETARASGAFSNEVRTLLRDNAREFHLEPAGKGRWDLFPVLGGRQGKAVRVQARRRP
ncbi:MAG: hypothetical protein KIS66_14385 [Fimbriimonadaceae bacterium]|nr:hypothetical protein [Fimbriimonadaceae bacterium]